MTYEEAIKMLDRIRDESGWTNDAYDSLTLAIEALEKQIPKKPKGIIVDAVPVVRCKDCVHSYDDLCGLCCTCGPYVDCVVQPEFYCADGKRKRDK